MMKSWTLFLGAALVVVLGACSDDNDDGGSGPGGPALNGTVENFLFEDVPVEGVLVGSGSVVAATASDGSFTLPDVTAPYDLIAATPVVADGGIIFNGYAHWSEDAPELGSVPIGWNNPDPAPVSAAPTDIPMGALTKSYANDAAEMEITATSVDATGESVRVSVGDGQRSVDRTISNLAAPTLSNVRYMWTAAVTQSVDVGALQIDASGEFHYGRTSAVVLVRNTTNTTTTVNLNPVAGGTGTIDVALGLPAGQDLSSVDWKAFAIIDGLPIQADAITTQTGSLRVPQMPNATYYVTVSATLEVAGNSVGRFAASRPGVAVGTTVDIEAVAPPTLDSPADAATNVALQPNLEFTPSTGAMRGLVSLTSQDPYGEVDTTWTVMFEGSQHSVELPVTPGVGASLHPSVEHRWGIYSFLEGQLPTAANILLYNQLVSEPYPDLSLAQSGPITMTVSQGADFTTEAP